MLLDRIRALFADRPTEPDDSAASSSAPSADVDPLAVAACVLLLDLAYADGEFSESERAHLQRVLEQHFSLPPDSVRGLLEIAEKERGDSVDYFRFTSQLQLGYDVGQKMLLAEIMWGVVLADGGVTDHEQYLTRKISNLLGLKPGYLAAAKSAAASRKDT